VEGIIVAELISPTPSAALLIQAGSWQGLSIELYCQYRIFLEKVIVNSTSYYLGGTRTGCLFLFRWISVPLVDLRLWHFSALSRRFVGSFQIWFVSQMGICENPV